VVDLPGNGRGSPGICVIDRNHSGAAGSARQSSHIASFRIIQARLAPNTRDELKSIPCVYYYGDEFLKTNHPLFDFKLSSDLRS
jgi:hypothetical protein